MDIYRVAFIGHREIYGQSRIEEEIEKTAIKLLDRKDYVEFYVGRNGDFDIAVATAIKRVQRNFGKHHNSLILVLPYPTKYDEYYEEFYDEIYYPNERNTHYKAAITKRNQWMVDNCEQLISYVERNEGGAYKTLQYAKEQEKPIVNLYETIHD